MEKDYYKKYEPLFGAWHITEKIGEGAFGQVFVIERHELGVTYKSALKAITIPQSRSEVLSVMSDGMSEVEVTAYYKNMVQSIIDEFIMMTKLKGNSHIVSYEDHLMIEHEDDIGWDILIRMELLIPLLEHAADNPMEEKDVIKLGLDLCRALEFCRKYDIIHRDIKPENIFIAPSGDYKLGDFGIAVTVEKTQIGLSRRGTYAYMSPEVYLGRAYGPSVDVYSLGIVMYKFLNNNRTPFLPDYPKAIVPDDRELSFSRRLEEEQIPAPQKGSPRLKQIVLKACAFKPEDRYRTATQMRRELEGALSEDDDKNNEALSHTLSAKKIITKKKKALALTVASLLIVAALAFATIPKEIDAITGIKKETTIYIGDTYKPKYTIKPDFFADERIKFAVSEEAVLEVNAKGALTGKGVGESRLLLSAKGYTRRVKVKVIPKVTDISNVDSKIWVEIDSTRKLAPKLSPSKFADEKITYNIGNSDIARIDSTDKIIPKKEGSTQITISAGGCEKTITLVVYKYVEPQNNYVQPTWTYENNNSGDEDGYFKDSDDEYF